MPTHNLNPDPFATVFDDREKIVLLIDGSNLYAAMRGCAWDIDYKRLLTSFPEHGQYLLRAYYYTAINESVDAKVSIRPLIDWLQYNGYTLRSKPIREYIDAQGGRRLKGNMDVELAIDALALVEHVDHYVLFSGDGDFAPLVTELQRRGRKVTVVSTMKSDPPMTSDELRRCADHFIEIDDMRAQWARLETSDSHR